MVNQTPMDITSMLRLLCCSSRSCCFSVRLFCCSSRRLNWFSSCSASRLYCSSSRLEVMWGQLRVTSAGISTQTRAAWRKLWLLYNTNNGRLPCSASFFSLPDGVLLLGARSPVSLGAERQNRAPRSPRGEVGLSNRHTHTPGRLQHNHSSAAPASPAGGADSSRQPHGVKFRRGGGRGREDPACPCERSLRQTLHTQRLVSLWATLFRRFDWIDSHEWIEAETDKTRFSDSFTVLINSWVKLDSCESLKRTRLNRRTRYLLKYLPK